MGIRSGARRAALLAVAALWAVMPIPAMLGFIQAVQAAPLETYGRLPTLENVALSPDGSRLAFVRTDESTRVLVLADLSPSPRRPTGKLRWSR